MFSKLITTALLLLVILILEVINAKKPTGARPRTTMNVTNVTRLYSPITLNREWSTLGRLAAGVFVSCFGATVNGFFITSFFIEQELKRVGNVYLACVGLADMIITAGVLPMSAAVLLSGEWDTTPVCHFIQSITTTSTYMYSLFFTLVAGETYTRVYHSNVCFLIMDVHRRLVMVILLVIGLAVSLGVVGTYWKLDYDYCLRQHNGNLYFRLGTSVLLHGVCGILTVYALIASTLQIREHNRIRTRYHRSLQFQRDKIMIKLNLFTYCMYVVAWIPYLVVVYHYPEASDGQIYSSATVGISRALLTSVFYGTLHSAFGKAYSNLFYYCCCKTSLTSYSPRQRRVNDTSNAPRPIIADVRTHIMAPAVNSPQRATTSTQETIEL